MLRDIIEIEQSLCDGCGDCVPACHEGALQIIDNKAHLISDLMCDGLGACLGACPTGAMKVLQREAEPYDERQVMVNIIKGGKNVIKAHLDHLLNHNELAYHAIAVEVLHEQNILHETSTNQESKKISNLKPLELSQASVSQLSHWPVQLHLINPANPNFSDAHLLLAADCSAFAAGDFHQRYLKDKKLAIACPKLDSNQQSYIEKLTLMIRHGKLKSLTILRMDVPCCGGLAQLAQKAIEQAKRDIPLNEITINKQGVEI
ncbi:MAG: NAD-dependent dihydropyrimidine dehydrogenase PreA subunit [Psychromonas sp.]|jgi:NAD-dependent dihydropyrimidine dehydrogenase PreA subunit|uniref:ATP-binding protein n=1 Tax=Psychromonas sp. TaxID=1884585 RepID=UPI0039E3D0B5